MELSQILREQSARERLWPAEPLTPEMAAAASIDDDVLVVWNEQAGVEPNRRLIVKRIVGGAFGVSPSVAGRIIVLYNDNVYLKGFEFVDGGMSLWFPRQKWTESWRAAAVGEEFTYRQIKNRKVSAEELRATVRGKVFPLRFSS